jgi:hypothetical protein
MSTKAALISVLLALQLAGAQCLAHSKTDVVVFYNGDRLTGEIKSMLGGLLSYGTSPMGTIDIEWQKIAEISSAFHYEFRLTSGELYYGSLAKSSQQGLIKVSTPAGDHEIPLLEVVEIRQIGDDIEERFSARLGAGYSFTKASEVTQASLTSNFSFEDEKGVTGLDGRSTLSDTEEAKSRSNRYSLTRQMWTRWPKMIRYLSGVYEDSDELQLDHRVSIGLGLGRSFIDNDRSSVLGFLGLQYQSEKSEPGDKRDSLELAIGTEIALWRFDSPEYDVKMTYNLYPGLTESGRLRGNADVRFSWELIEDLFWDVTFWGTYDNDTPSSSDYDYGVTTGLGWTY